MYACGMRCMIYNIGFAILRNKVSHVWETVAHNYETQNASETLVSRYVRHRAYRLELSLLQVAREKCEIVSRRDKFI